eukprot:GABV01001908.1.p2 GENE.GABV01001908.1~~GABV01001908.1.p2  ORF type:complete len:216 (-),score=115.10 GABV01001908.1:11-658(-)
MNTYIHRLGVSEDFDFHDVFGMDPELLMMVPRPCYGVVLLFPITENSEKAKGEEEERIKKDGQTVSDKVYFTKQTVGNACGTVGLIHLILNNPAVKLDEDKFFAKFKKETANMNPDERAKALEDNRDIEEEHQVVAAAGESKIEDIERINLHFVALVNIDGHLYELDGRKPFPINHGPTTDDSVLEDAAKVAKQFMDRDPTNVNFNIVSLGPKAI